MLRIFPTLVIFSKSDNSLGKRI